MQTIPQTSVQQSQEFTQKVAISSTFTAEPIEAALAFWINELDVPATIEFAPYNQVFQQLLDPASLQSQNTQGVNIILLRFEDWRRNHNHATTDELVATIERNLQDVITGLQAAVRRSTTPYIVCRCPDSPTTKADSNWAAFSQQLEAKMLAELSYLSGLHLVTAQDWTTYPVEDYYDSQRDKLGHIPFTPMFFTAIATILARKIYAIKTAPHKVIVLDCDNTIWQGIVGEDGVMGIELTPAYHALQEFMLAQQAAGMLLCFCSKNNEPDVLEVFDRRPEMPLKLQNLVAWRINWLPKSENIKSLAQELNLGLDSFIFIDDNPMECAEVQTNCPEVLTLQLPVKGDIPKFLQHVWAFDHLKVTEEDKQRTTLYQQNLERDRFQRQALTINDFLAGLELKVEISEPTAAQLPRVAQLTQRTNQFNVSTIRRSENEIQQLAQRGLECRIVEVCDRFGDYGLVGVMIFGAHDSVLTVDTFLLSCRVLGRGVEHQMLQHLAEIAAERNLGWVTVPYLPTKKNLPARNFLDSVAADFKQSGEAGDRFVLPMEVATSVIYTPGAAPLDSSNEVPAAKQPTAPPAVTRKSKRLSRIASQLQEPEAIFDRVSTQQRTTRPALEQPYLAPRTEVETLLATLWAELLHLDTVGIQDNYFDLGGTSLLSVELFARIETIFGRKLPLTTLLEAPTIEQLANLITRSDAISSIALIKQGGSKLPVFLIHDGDGETMLYRNLAYRLDSEHPVYGIQPYARDRYPILHTRIADMAAYYLKQIRSVQPEGPYLLGGMCAGGVLSFEVARQLQSQGQAIAMVALIDAADVEAPQRTGRITNQRLQRFSSALATDHTQLSLPTRWQQIVTKVGRKVANTIAYEVQTRLKKGWNQVRMKLFRYWLDKEWSTPGWLQNIPVRTAYVFAEREYVPPSQFEGEVVLFRASQGEGADVPYAEIYSDPLLGWGKRVTASVRVFDIPGGHSSMLQEPNVAVMATAMQAYIDTAIAPAAANCPPSTCPMEFSNLN
jgi:FkbH-like protein